MGWGCDRLVRRFASGDVTGSPFVGWRSTWASANTGRGPISGGVQSHTGINPHGHYGEEIEMGLNKTSKEKDKDKEKEDVKEEVEA